MFRNLLFISLALACPYSDNHIEKRGVTPFNLPGATQLGNAWTKVTSSAATTKSYTYSKPLVLLQSMPPVVSHISDEMPDGRLKRIHAAGAVAKVRLVSVPNPYTGLFQGASNALIRFSLSIPPTLDNIVPGAALKLFRDNLPSANTFFMASFFGQRDPNYFVEDMSNHVSPDGPPGISLIVNKFGSAPTNWSPFTGVSDIASYDVSGKKVEKPVYPFQLIYRPTAQAKSAIAAGLAKIPANDIYKSVKALTSIPKGTTLWDVYASNSPTGKFSKIGSIVTDSAVVMNAYGDEKLFFKHQTWEDDVKPDSFGAAWKASCPNAYSCQACNAKKTCQFQ
jgi:hypothetical protein